MDDNINLAPVKVEVDLTEVVNKAYDDTVSPSAKETGKGLAFCFRFLGSLLKPFMYEKIQEAEYKCKEIDKKLEEKYNQIPDTNKAEPRTSILGPALDTLKYNLDEEHIKEMFINILSSELDNRKQSKVLPSYTFIINQLSKNDAMFLKLFKDFKTGRFHSIEFIYRHKTNGGTRTIDKYICQFYFKNGNIDEIGSYKLNNIILDNLTRLNLIKVDYLNHYNDNLDVHQKLFEANSQQYPEKENYTLDYNKGYVALTEFGRNFINICLS